MPQNASDTRRANLHDRQPRQTGSRPARSRLPGQTEDQSASDVLTALAVAALEDLKATNIVILDVRELTDVTDTMVIASGRSSRQVTALAEKVVLESKQIGHRPLGVEGLAAGEWVLVDLNDIVVHVMLPEQRELYQLEKLWGDFGASIQGTGNDPSPRPDAASSRTPTPRG